MTTHEPDLNRLAAFAEGALPLPERAALADHLAVCAACRSVIAALGREPSIAPARRLPPWVVPIAASLAAVAVGGGVWIVSRRQSPPSTSVAAPSPSSNASDDAVRASPVRTVSGRRFRLVAGEWIDTGYDAAALLPERAIATSTDRTRALAERPDLAPFFELGDHFLVVADGTVYRVDLRHQAR